MVSGNVAVTMFERDAAHPFLDSVWVRASIDWQEKSTRLFRICVINEEHYTLASERFPCTELDTSRAWVRVPMPAVELPERFGIGVAWPGEGPPLRLDIDPDAGASCSYLRDASGEWRSFGGDTNWMIRPELTLQPEPGRGVHRLRDWQRPVERIRIWPPLRKLSHL